MCLIKFLNTFAEAKAEPGAARPNPVKYSNYFTGEGNTLKMKIINLYIKVKIYEYIKRH